MRLRTVLVRGPSMEPALRDGDCLLVLRGARVRPGAVVVARFLGRPGLLVVKRAVAPAGAGVWQLASDNAGAPGAARGPGDVEAVVLLRWWPLPPRRVARRPPADGGGAVGASRSG